jgi:hypothetical protein
MALTGELSDLSLAELIEFFCNQRKTGRLKVIYSIGPGYFYLEAGSVVHARIGVLRGIEAVYCALTLQNASFSFSPAFEPPEHSINQPWTSVVLEGLRRMDEGIAPSNPFPEEAAATAEEFPTAEPQVVLTNSDEPVRGEQESPPAVIDVPVARPTETPAFLLQAGNESRWRGKPWSLAAILFAVVLVLTAVGVPWGMYARNKAAKLATEARTAPGPNPENAAPSVPVNDKSAAPTPDETVVPAANSAEAEQFAKRQRDRAKERARSQETANAAFTGSPQPEAKSASIPANPSSVKPQPSPSAAGRRVTVQVNYDENGRVTQASGGDATALRIARQKRFPVGKAGSATVTIPIN